MISISKLTLRGRISLLALATLLLGLSLFSWLGVQSMPFVIFSIVLGLIILIKFLPTARVSWARAKNKRDFIFDRGLRNRR